MKKLIPILLMLTILSGIIWYFAQEGPPETPDSPITAPPTQEPPESPRKVKIVEQYTFKGQWVALYEDNIWRTEDKNKNLILLEEPLLTEVKNASKKFREKEIQSKPKVSAK